MAASAFLTVAYGFFYNHTEGDPEKMLSTALQRPSGYVLSIQYICTAIDTHCLATNSSQVHLRGVGVGKNIESINQSTIFSEHSVLQLLLRSGG